MFQLVQGQAGQLPALAPGGFLHRCEAPAEAVDGRLQRAFGIHTREPGHVDGGEEEIA